MPRRNEIFSTGVTKAEKLSVSIRQDPKNITPALQKITIELDRIFPGTFTHHHSSEA